MYADVVCAERNFIDSGVSKFTKLAVWQGLEKLQPYFTSLTYSEDMKQAFKNDVEDWGRKYIAAFDETHVTHHIVSFILIFFYSFIEMYSRGTL